MDDLVLAADPASATLTLLASDMEMRGEVISVIRTFASVLIASRIWSVVSAPTRMPEPYLSDSERAAR